MYEPGNMCVPSEPHEEPNMKPKQIHESNHCCRCQHRTYRSHVGLERVQCLSVSAWFSRVMAHVCLRPVIARSLYPKWQSHVGTATANVEIHHVWNKQCEFIFACPRIQSCLWPLGQRIGQVLGCILLRPSWQLRDPKHWR